MTVPHVRLSCVIPAGIGQNLTMAVSRGSQSSALTVSSASDPLFSYAGPVLTPLSLRVTGRPLRRPRSCRHARSLVLSNNPAGLDSLTFDGAFFGTNSSAVMGRYGPASTAAVGATGGAGAAGLGWRDCSPITALSDTSVTCRAAPGVGAANVFVLGRAFAARRRSLQLCATARCTSSLTRRLSVRRRAPFRSPGTPLRAMWW